MSKSDSLHITHCSELKNSEFKNTSDSTTPDILYTSDRIKLFFQLVKGDDLPWAIFSDKYGFVFPTSTIQWYDLAPDGVTQEEVERLIDYSIDELQKFEKIVYLSGKKPIHSTYKWLISSMKSRGLNVFVKSG